MVMGSNISDAYLLFRAGVHLDSFILLGKLHYAMGQYSEALRFYDRAQIEALEEKQLPPRSLKIMAEAFAIRAMCIEKTGSVSGSGGKTSRAKAAERDAAVAKAYEVAGDLTLLYLQVDRSLCDMFIH
jgi:tetratricopeptide (TPR) repeat protein